MSATTSLAAGTGARPSARRGLSGQFRAWAGAADEGETQWAVVRSPLARLAAWSLVGILVVGGVIGRAHLGLDTTSWVLMTAANALALALAIAGLRQSRMPPVLYAGVLAVFVIGGLLQVYFLSFNLENRTFINARIPTLNWITTWELHRVYEVTTLAFVVYCLMIAVLASLPVRTGHPRQSTATELGTFTLLLASATVVFVAFTALQLALGFGRGGLRNPVLPLKIVPITLFFRLQVYPILMLLGVWVFDRRNSRLSYLCVAGIGMVALSDAYISTHRGAVVNFGIPVLFLWLLTGRFTKFRKSLVVVGIVVYLVSAPVLSALRVDRVLEATGRSGRVDAGPLVSTEKVNYQVAHFLLRVGGASSMMFVVHHSGQLSLDGLVHVYRPYGLTDYFTHDVVGVPEGSIIAQGRSPTLIGMGTLIGGTAGTVLLVILTTLAFAAAWHWIAGRLWSWPVALVILSHSAVVFFSEGVTILLYKSLLSIVVAEVVYVLVARPSSAQVVPTTSSPAGASAVPVDA